MPQIGTAESDTGTEQLEPFCALARPGNADSDQCSHAVHAGSVKGP